LAADRAGISGSEFPAPAEPCRDRRSGRSPSRAPSREFRRYFSTTVGEFLRRKRIEHACHLVSTTNIALAEIAMTCGFSDQSHFSATFRRQVGLTPARFRQMAQAR